MMAYIYAVGNVEKTPGHSDLNEFYHNFHDTQEKRKKIKFYSRIG